MDIVIHGHNLKVTEALREYATKKIGSFSKLIDPANVYVTLSVVHNVQTVEVTIPLNGVMIRAEEKSEDMYASIDLVINKLQTQITKYKAKHQRLDRNEIRTKLKKTLPSDELLTDIEEEDSKVVRVKRFETKPMSLKEAMLQMELLDHNFFVFVDGETNLVHVLYRRQDGNYGLIETVS